MSPSQPQRRQLAWWSAGLPFGFIELLDWQAPHKWLAVASDPEWRGAFVVVRRFQGVFYVIGADNIHVLF